MAQNELGQSLSRATRIVMRFVGGELSASAFVAEYANFYYYEALDGHERSSAKEASDRARYWIAIELHKRIQLEVINQLSLDSEFSLDVLREAGRIDEIEGRERARAICAEKGVEAVLEILEGGNH